MKILVVDDHPLTREALRGVFADLDSNAALLEAAIVGKRCASSPNTPTSRLFCLI